MKPTITPQDIERFEKQANDAAERQCNGIFPIEYTREQVVKHTKADIIQGMTSATLYEREQAIKFAEWLPKNGWEKSSGTGWRKTIKSGRGIKAEFEYKTTAELFTKFLNENKTT